MDEKRIVIIGAGRMGGSLITGLIKNGYQADQILAADPNPKKLQQLKNAYAIHVTTQNNEAAAAAQVLLLAIKPQVFDSVVGALKETAIRTKPLILSVAAGITTARIQQLLSPELSIVRAMPNMPACIGYGATAFYATPNTPATSRREAMTILQAVGTAIELPEETLMDTVTALSGSGPAYVFHMMHALETAAISLGLPEAIAHDLTIQTVLGAAMLANTSKESFNALQQSILSKGGTTEAAINVLQAKNVQAIYKDALRAAEERSIALSRNP